jgi:cation diffusion facilitator CzcD-associated flavoprotein CzcO
MADQSQSQYRSTYQIDSNQYELVLSFFRGVTTTLTAAKSYTQNLFDISAQTGYDIMDLLDAMSDQDALQVTATMAYFLNSFSDKTVMYGVSSIMKPNSHAGRNVIQ